ncbi:MAG: hypothetical protein PHY31_03410 [Smithellaceae bacterium]|nr:hypothetical protein [Smithellaceae bacterium]
MADNDKKDGKGPIPPYLPYKTFIRLIGAFKESTVPQRIDQSVLSKFSGSEIAALIPALKFFDLINKDQMTQQRLLDLVDSYGTPGWKIKLKEIMTISYAEIIDGLHLDSATRKQLDEKFNAVAAGAVADKCTRFYISAATEAGITLSSFITMRKKAPRTGPKTVKIPKAQIVKKIAPKGEIKEPSADESSKIPSGCKEFSIPVRGKSDAKIWIPDNIDEKEWNGVKENLELTIKMIENFFGFGRKDK